MNDPKAILEDREFRVYVHAIAAAATLLREKGATKPRPTYVDRFDGILLVKSLLLREIRGEAYMDEGSPNSTTLVADTVLADVFIPTDPGDILRATCNPARSILRAYYRKTYGFKLAQVLALVAE